MAPGANHRQAERSGPRLRGGVANGGLCRSVAADEGYNARGHGAAADTTERQLLSGADGSVRQWAVAAMAALGALTAIACSTTAASTQDPATFDVAGAVQATALGAGDVLGIRVYLHQDLDGEYTVAADGTLTFPLAGQVHVEGMDVAQVGALLRQRLGNGYIRDPQVIVALKALNSKKIFVLGQVKTPGRFTFGDNMTVVEAVTVAGGFGPMAERNYTIVTRGSRRIPLPVERIMQGLAPNFPLQPGDIVYVPTSFL